MVGLLRITGTHDRGHYQRGSAGRMVTGTAGVAADAVADEIVVGTEDPLRLGAPEIAVARHAFSLAPTEVEVHPLAAQALAAFARFNGGLDCQCRPARRSEGGRGETCTIAGVVPGIDFCGHDQKPPSS